MYQVGQVVYVIVTKKQRVVPVQIVEQIIKRSTKGESIQYRVSIPGKSDLIDLKLLGAEIYQTLDELRDQLRQNAETAIQEMIKQAQELTREHFIQESIAPHQPDVMLPFNEHEGMKVTLGDGTIANVTIGDSMVINPDPLISNKKKVTN